MENIRSTRLASVGLGETVQTFPFSKERRDKAIESLQNWYTKTFPMTQDLKDEILKLYRIGATDLDIMEYLKISSDTLADYLNNDEEIVSEKRNAKAKLIIRARKTVYEALNKDPKFARQYLIEEEKKLCQKKSQSMEQGDMLVKPSADF